MINGLEMIKDDFVLSVSPVERNLTLCRQVQGKMDMAEKVLLIFFVVC